MCWWRILQDRRGELGFGKIEIRRDKMVLGARKEYCEVVWCDLCNSEDKEGFELRLLVTGALYCVVGICQSCIAEMLRQFKKGV